MPTPRVLIIVPAYNESGSIARVVGQIHHHLPAADVVVIDDGSADDTAHLARAAGAIVLQMPYNVGIGAAMQTGFMYAAANNYDIAVQADGDGQHPASEISRLIDALQTTDADVVIGSRFIEDRGYQQVPLRRLGGRLLSQVLRAATGLTITDPTSGFRASGRRALSLCATLYPHDYPEPEAIIIFQRAGLHITEIPVTMSQRTTGVSSITPLRSAYYMTKVVLSILINLLRAPAVTQP